MKTGYDQHFKKIKRSSNAPVFNVKDQKRQPVRPSAHKEKKPAFPIKPLLSFILIAAAGLLFLENFELVETYLKKVEITMGTAQAAETKTEIKTEVKSDEKPSENSADNKNLPLEVKKLDDAEYLFKLADRKKQLDQREIELNLLAELIEKQKVEITEKLAKLEETRIRISTALEEKIKAEDGKVETLVQMYTNMKPAQAAKIFETLDEDLVIEILSRMKKKSAADILNLIKPEKAQLFAERYTGYRSPANK